MIIDSVKDYIKTCPFLKNGRINANYLGEKAVRYAIDNVPAPPTIKKYSDGGEQRQFVFIFGSREPYSSDTLENFDTSGFYEKFASWIEEQNNNKVFPILDNKCRALRVEILTSGYLFTENNDTARYQIQCRLIYYKGA